MSPLPTDTCNRCGHFRVEDKQDELDNWYQRCQHKELLSFNSVRVCVCDHFFWHPTPEDLCGRCGHWRNEHDFRGCRRRDQVGPSLIYHCSCPEFRETQMPFRWLQAECASCGHARAEHGYGNGIPYLGACQRERQVADGTDVALWQRCACALFREPEPTDASRLRLPGVCAHCHHAFEDHRGDQGQCRHITPIDFEATAGHGRDCPCPAYIAPYVIAHEGHPVSGREALRLVHVTELLSYPSGKFEPNWNGWFHDFFQNSGSETLIGPVALVEDDEGGLNLVPVSRVSFIPGG